MEMRLEKEGRGGDDDDDDEDTLWKALSQSSQICILMLQAWEALTLIHCDFNYRNRACRWFSWLSVTFVWY
jgi:hypothetical protein